MRGKKERKKEKNKGKVGRDFNLAGNLFVVRHKFAAFSQHGHVLSLFFSAHFFLNFIFQALERRPPLVHEEIKKRGESCDGRSPGKIFNAFSRNS